jgi:hypothetical protein
VLIGRVCGSHDPLVFLIPMLALLALHVAERVVVISAGGIMCFSTHFRAASGFTASEGVAV